MRVRVTEAFTEADRTYHTGEVVHVSPKKAKGWIKAGRVRQDKSLDGASETKGAR